MKVSVKDFQIVKSASLEFVPGLTVINGESNNGKSALFRAVKSCIYNEPGTTNVRMGCKNYTVGIEFNNHRVILQKGDNSLYMIDGKQYNKIGKTQVPEVAEALGITALNINDSTEKINFWDQMEKPFLLDRNSSDLFRFIVDSGEDDNLNTTLRSMVTDKNRLNTEKNLKEGSIQTLKTQIDNMETTLAGFADKIQLCENIISYGPLTSRLLTTKTIITNITNTTNEIKEITNTINKAKEEYKLLTDDMNKISYSISKKEQLKEIITQINNVAADVAALNDVINKKVDFKLITNKLSKTIDNYMKVGEIVRKIGDINEFIRSNNVTRIECSIGQDEINKLSMLHDLLARINKLHNTLKQVDVDKAALKEEYEPFIKEYSSIDVCPYCGNKLHGKEAA